MTPTRLPLFAAALFVSSTPLTSIADPPTPGATVRDVQSTQPLPEPKRSAPLTVEQMERQPLEQTDGTTVAVSAFRITGATVFPENELQRLVREYVGKDVTLEDLQDAAGQITDYYQENGYLVARAYVPAQEINAGVVEISVLEGRVGNVIVKVDGRKQRLNAARAKEFVTQSFKVGDVVQEQGLERGLLLLNDMPALEVRSTLQPGASLGTSDLIVEATGRQLFDGAIDADSYGSRYTGGIRMGGTVNLNSPLGWGDVVTLRGLTTDTADMKFGRLSYTVPVNSLGTRVGAAFTYVDYQIGKDFSYLNAQGDAKVISLYGLHPLARTRDFSLYASLGFDHKDYKGEANNETTSDKSGRVWLAGIAGELRDGWLRAGVNEFGITLFHGKQQLNDSPDRFVDSLTAQTNGTFTKVNFNVSRLQDLAGLYSVKVGLSGQFASRNLDSAEQFTLGGPFGIRAWPQGEASGDKGYVATTELHWDRSLQWGPSNLQLLAFFDAGSVQLHKHTWDGWQGNNARLRNRYTLYGVGLGANLTSLDSFTVRTSYGWQLSSNPGRDVRGFDSDNTSRGGHFWLQALKWFR